MSDIRNKLEQLTDEFEFLEDWENKYRHIIDLGRKLPQLEPYQKSDSNKVSGCASQVWLISDFSPETGLVKFSGGSDSSLVQGLLSIFIFIYSEATPMEIISLPPAEVFEKLGLNDALTPSRANGLKSIAAKIMAFAHLNS